ncbi:MAG: PAS domain S-box protein [Spirochaetes bacterium]|jgi:PAS domain S-box-containing protein|nr:PAS domain S-box protein [Spirochaetota bacterium]
MPPSKSRARRILIVEDQAIIAMAQKRMLSAHGYHVVTAHSGERAVDLVREGPAVDLVLMDIDLGPGIDGTEAATAMLDIRELPIVFVTSHSERAMVEKVKGITRYGYVLKSAGEFVLLESINMAFELFEANRALRERNEELQRSKQSLELSEARYRMLFENLVAGVALHEMIYDVSGRAVDSRFLAVNPAFEALTGLRRDAVVGKRVRDVLPNPEDRSIETYAEVVRTKEPASFRDYNAEVGKYFSVSAFSPEPNRFAVVFTDITDTVLAENAERHHFELLQQVIEVSPISILLLDSTGRIRYANSRASEVLGVSREEITNRGFADPEWHITDFEGSEVPREDLPFEVVRRTGKPVFGVEHAVRGPGGRQVLLSMNAVPLRDENGDFDGTVVALEDVTEMRREQAAVVDSRERYRTMAALTMDIIAQHNLEGKWTFVNDTAVNFFGLPRDELIGRSYMDFVHPDDVETAQVSQESMRQEGRSIWGLINRQWTPRGWRTVEWNSAPIHDSNGTCIGYQASGRDITDRIAASERIEGLLKEKDLLLHEVHHRIKNDLSVISSLLSLQAQDSEHQETVRALDDAARRVGVMRQVYQRLYTGESVERVELRSFAESVLSDLQSGVISARVALHTTGEGLSTTPRAAVALGIILNELLTNSQKYAFGDDQDQVISVELERPEPDAVTLRVADNGEGFPKHILRGEGYGFGLTVVNALVQQHGGSLSLSNEEGATARVTLRD